MHWIPACAGMTDSEQRSRDVTPGRFVRPGLRGLARIFR